MSLFTLYFLAAAASKANSRHARTRRGSYKANGSSKALTPISTGPSFERYVLKEMGHGNCKELNEFMQKWFSCGEELVQEYNKGLDIDLDNKVDQTNEKLREELAILKRKEDRLRQLNISLGDAEHYPDLNLDDFTFYESFNGLKSSWFGKHIDDNHGNKDMDDEFFKAQKAKLSEKAYNIDYLKKTKDELVAQIVSLEKKLKLPFNKKDNYERLAKAQEELKKIDSSLGMAIDFAKELDIYGQLNDEQKLAIRDYIKETNKVWRIKIEFEDYYYNRPNPYSSVHLTISNSNDTDYDLWYRALSRLFEKEDIELSYLDKVFEQVEQAPAKWIDKDSEMCSFGPKDFRVDKYRQLLHFFMEEIFYPEYSEVLTRRVTYTDIAAENAKVYKK